MASIVIHVTSYGAASPDNGNHYFGGWCRTGDMVAADASIWWQAEVGPNAVALAINNACRDAAIDAATAAGRTVGLLDARTIIGGAVALGV